MSRSYSVFDLERLSDIANRLEALGCSKVWPSNIDPRVLEQPVYDALIKILESIPKTEISADWLKLGPTFLIDSIVKVFESTKNSDIHNACLNAILLDPFNYSNILAIHSIIREVYDKTGDEESKNAEFLRKLASFRSSAAPAAPSSSTTSSPISSPPSAHTVSAPIPPGGALTPSSSTSSTATPAPVAIAPKRLNIVFLADGKVDNNAYYYKRVLENAGFDPKNMVYLFPGNGQFHHDEKGDYRPFTPKGVGGGGLAGPIPMMDRAHYPTLSLPTAGLAETGYADVAIRNLWRLAGRAMTSPEPLGIAVVTRPHLDGYIDLPPLTTISDAKEEKVAARQAAFGGGIYATDPVATNYARYYLMHLNNLIKLVNTCSSAVEMQAHLANAPDQLQAFQEGMRGEPADWFKRQFSSEAKSPEMPTPPLGKPEWQEDWQKLKAYVAPPLVLDKRLTFPNCQQFIENQTASYQGTTAASGIGSAASISTSSSLFPPSGMGKSKFVHPEEMSNYGKLINIIKIEILRLKSERRSEKSIEKGRSIEDQLNLIVNKIDINQPPLSDADRYERLRNACTKTDAPLRTALAKKTGLGKSSALKNVEKGIDRIDNPSKSRGFGFSSGSNSNG